jgi:hypothetical protein
LNGRNRQNKVFSNKQVQFVPRAKIFLGTPQLAWFCRPSKYCIRSKSDLNVGLPVAEFPRVPFVEAVTVALFDSYTIFAEV